MSDPIRPTNNPADAAVLPPQAPVAGAAPLFSGRQRVTQRDLEMYAALVGVPHTLLIQSEPALAEPTLRVSPNAPRLSAWVRKLSRRAKQQLRQAQVRLAASARKPGA